MELISRRKKRKTRKCLNELRRSLLSKENEGKTTGLLINCNQISNKGNFIIGCKRLTLGLFNKAVRSETVTRSALSKTLQQNDLKASVNEEDHLHRENSSYIGSSPENQSLTYKAIKQKKHLEGNCSIKGNRIKNFKTKNHQLNNHTLHSAAKPNTISKRDILVSDESSMKFNENESSIDSFPLNNSLHLYEKLIYSMPKYLLGNTPTLIKYDVLKSTKEFLYNMYVGDYRHETERNLLQCIQKKISREQNDLDVIIFSPLPACDEDPMNYLKSKFAREKQSTVTPTLCCSNSIITDKSMSSGSHSLIHDTPECIYFPHKLNH